MLHPPLTKTPLPARHDGQVLYVGKGPSAPEVREYLNWGDLAVVNDANRIDCLSERHCHVLFADGYRNANKAALNRVGLVVLPHDNSPQELPVPVFQFVKAIDLRPGNAYVAIRDREPAYFQCPSPSGVTALWLLGYTKIWLFGHDGGVGLCEPFPQNQVDYSDRRRVIEAMVPLLAERGCQVKLWPDRFV